MELCIYFSNLKRLLDMDEALRVIDTEKIPSHLITVILSLDSNIYDYSVNLASSTWIQAMLDSGMEFSRLYFGQEFCENLTPTADEVEQAFYYSKQFGWNFTYVTGGYQTEAGNEKIMKNLAKLHELDPESEVVVNDWGILYRISHDYPQFKIVLGRQANKQTRMNLFTRPGANPPVYVQGLDTDESEIRRSQIRAFADIAVNNPDYLELLKSLGVTNIDLDMTPQGLRRPEDGWEMTLGYYYPWAFIATGRNCPTAGVAEPQRTYVMTDRQCGRPCQRYNCSPQLIQFEQPLIQRGPALFIAADDYQERYFQGTPNYERLIYEPFIPI